MIQVSNAFLTALESGRRNFVYSLDVTLANSDTLTIGNDDIMIGGIGYEDAVSDDSSFNALGSAIINCANVSLYNRNKQYSQYDFNGARIIVNMGLMINESLESFQRGSYIVDKARVVDASNTIELSMLDKMVNLDKPYATSLTYPAYISDVISEICTNCGIQYNGTIPSAFNYVQIPSAPTFETTYREVLSFIATIVGCYARVNRLGLLELSWFASAPQYDIPFSNIQAQTVDNADIELIGISIEYESSTGETITVDSTSSSGFTLKISNNPFITADNVNTILNYLVNKLVGLTFRKADISHYNNPLIEAGDVVELTNRYDDTYNILVTQTIFKHGAYQTTRNASETVSNNIGTRPDRILTAVQEVVKIAKGASIAANGKNRRITSDTNPGTIGFIEGDIWFQNVGGTGQDADYIIAVYNFNGTSWELQPLTSAAFAYIDAIKITTGMLQGTNTETSWNLDTGEWQSYGEMLADDNDRDVSYLQKIAVNILNGLMTIKGEHANVHPASAEWTDYTDVIPTKNTDYMAIGLNEASLFDPNKVGCDMDIEPYGYAGIRLEGDTFKTFGQYQRDVFDSDETQDPTYSEGICFVRPYVTFGPDGIHFNCEYGETYAAANHNYLKYAVTTSGTVTPTTWTLRKEFETWFEQNYEEAANKYVWMMDDTGYGDPLYANDLYDGVVSPKEFLEALYISYEITEGEYGISDTATTQPSEWMTEGDIWLYLSEHTTETNNKYVWVKKDYYWRGSTVYTYNKFLASEYQETYTTPDLSEWLSIPAYNTFDIASGCSTVESALRFKNNFKTVSTYDETTDEEETHREYSPSDWESSGQSAVWPYQPGDTIVLSNWMHYWGCLYSSGAQLRLTIPVARPMSPYITGVTLSSGRIQVCNVSGTQLFATDTIPANTTALMNPGDPNNVLDIAITRKSSNWGATGTRQTVMARFADDVTLTFT